MKFLSELMENIIVKEGGSIKRLMRSEQFMAWWSSLLPRFTNCNIMSTLRSD